MQRNPTFEIPLATAHVGAAKAARCLHTYTLGTGLEGGGDGTLHGTTERHTTFELVRNTAGEQSRVGLCVLNFVDIELDDLVGQLLETGTKTLCLGTATSDDNTGTSSMDVDLNLLIADPLDVDTRDGAPLQLTLQVAADGPVLIDMVGIVGIGVPT